MGQAKNRGNKEQRMADAVARREALKPTEMICNDCKAVIAADRIEVLDTRNMPGLEMACYGTCPACQSVTWGFKGTQEAVQAFAMAMQEDHPDAIPALQNYKPKLG